MDNIQTKIGSKEFSSKQETINQLNNVDSKVLELKFLVNDRFELVNQIGLTKR